MKSNALYILIIILISSCSRNHTYQVSPSNWKGSVVSIKDNKKMQLIEAGSYKAFYGKDSGNDVHVNTFWLDEAPVTNREYLVFLKANPQWTRSHILRLMADTSYLHNWKSDFVPPANASLDAPVTNVSWFAAKAYAKSVGKRLPTVDEWEFAALADKTSKDASGKPAFAEYIAKEMLNRLTYLKPIKQEAPNYYGLYNMYGMVWEWTEDFNSVMIAGDSRGDNTANDENLFCAGSALSATDLKNYAAFMRYAMRGSVKANYCINNLGFRCAKNYIQP